MTPTDNSRAKALRVWEKTCDLMGEGVRTYAGAKMVSEAIGESNLTVDRCQALFKSLGILKGESEYEYQRQKVYWTLLVNREAGLAAINAHFDAGRGMNWPESQKTHHAKAAVEAPKAKVNGKVAIEKRDDEPVAAIAGPDAPTPFEVLRTIRRDDIEALIEAARQYAGRNEAINTKFDELAKLGISIDREKAMKAIHVERDPMLESVARVLPYIERLEKRLERAEADRDELLTLRRDNQRLSSEYNREKEANKRLAERNAQLIAARQ